MISLRLPSLNFKVHLFITILNEIYRDLFVHESLKTTRLTVTTVEGVLIKSAAVYRVLVTNYNKCAAIS